MKFFLLHLAYYEFKTYLLKDFVMEEEAGLREDLSVGDDRNQKEELYSKVVRAGKRTYFFDVKSTKYDEYYLTITESKKKIGKEGKVFYEKHKIFLYQEDFEKFTGGLNDVLDFIHSEKAPENALKMKENSDTENPVIENGSEFTNIDFDDLGRADKSF